MVLESKFQNGRGEIVLNEQLTNMWGEWQKAQDNMFDMWKKTLTGFVPEQKEGEATTANLSQEWVGQQTKMLDMYKDWLALYQPDKITSLMPKDWLQTPEKAMDAWKQWTSNLQLDKLPAVYKPEEFQAAVTKMYGDLYSTSAANMSDFLKYIPTTVGKEAFDRVMQSSNVYGTLYSFWNDMMSRIPGKADSAALKQWNDHVMQNYGKVLGSFAQSFLPEQIRSLLTNPFENASMAQQAFTDFFRPWMEESTVLQKNFLLALKGDRTAYIEFLREWNNLFQNSYGKLFHFPVIGSNRQIVEKMLKNVDSYIQYLVSVNEFNGSLSRIGMEVMEKLTNKISALAAEGKAPQTFKEFYKLWWKTNEEAYLELFKTETFSKMLNQTIDSGMRFKKGFDDTIQDLMAELPIPTRREMDSLEKTVYTLRKTVKSQAKLITELTEKVESLTVKGGTAQ